jgi:hypothetical protein
MKERWLGWIIFGNHMLHGVNEEVSDGEWGFKLRKEGRLFWHD